MVWLASNIGYILAVILTALAGFVSFWVTRKTKGTSTAVATALQVVNKMLPSLITTSENVNTGKTGETKKTYVMTFVETMLAGRGITMTDAIREEISSNIDEIVKATKIMHTTINKIEFNGSL